MLKKVFKSYDFPIFITVVLLCLFGLVMVYSSSMVTAVARYGEEMDFFYQKQKTAMILAFFLMLVAMIIPYKLYQQKKILMLMMSGIIGFLFLIFFIGHTAGGAQSWINVGTRAIQPGEFSKLAIIIYLAAIFGKRQHIINSIDKAVVPPITMLLIICALIAIQPDFGTAFIILLIAASIIIASGMSMKSLGKLLGISLIVAAIISLAILISGNFSEVVSKERVSRFTGLQTPFDPETIKDEGFHLANSLIAFGSGGVTGLGLGDSVQKYGYLPESHTDFILAIIGEELGLFGVVFVLGALGFIVLRGFVLAARCPDPFGSLLMVGISSMIGIQVFINAGGVSGLIPITGITLPFISYGGSSLLILMISIGILQNVVMRSNRLAEKKMQVKEKNIPM
ncbi:FtsW/RodA/SpoVE family cell cycle protein [Peribacillus saganii]|uniref:Probable peptidoglycan glycosyltransferase FtsW n=1 Tax=Peribacillus saganii TaxID=2303992 RepID=A0A372LSM8_9BACI|nr:FtsW/RodA/SpoVE family cell cycle protein [Peribacillus saganii]